MALCHNSALVFKLDSRTITCNLISEFDSYPTIFSNWHFIDIFIYSFWLSGSEEMQCSAISPIPSNFSSWNRTIGLQILYATVIQRRRSAPVNRHPHAAALGISLRAKVLLLTGRLLTGLCFFTSYPLIARARVELASLP